MKLSRLIQLVPLSVVILLMAPSFASAQEATPDVTAQEEANRDVIVRVGEEVITQGNFEIVDEFMADAYVVHSPLGDLDRDGFVGFMQTLRASLPDLNVTREILLVEEDHVAVRSSFTGTFDGAEFASPFGPLPPNEAGITLLVHSIFQLDEDGRIVEEWAMFDLLGFFTQLGAFPAPAS